MAIFKGKEVSQCWLLVFAITVIVSKDRLIKSYVLSFEL